jgi:hypothetical protein
VDCSGSSCARLCPIIAYPGNADACFPLHYYAHAWSTLVDLYSSQTRAHSVNTRIALATTKKNQWSVLDYYAKMCQLTDDLVASGAPLRDDELVAYILAGLDEDFNLIFTPMVALVDPITPSELYAQLLSFEQHTDLQSHTTVSGSSSAMAASRGHGFSGGRGSNGLSRGSSRGRGHGRGPSRGGDPNQSTSSAGPSSCPQCQLCLKIVHTAKKCWYHYEEDTSDQCNAALATSFGGENQWYTDSGATDHITGDLDQLIMHEPYHDNNQIHVVNGSCISITRIGNSIIPTPSRHLVLNNVLHFPSTHKNLIFIHRFTLDNNTFIGFHPYFFLINQGSKNEEGASVQSV